jgi:hypothetical protein
MTLPARTVASATGRAPAAVRIVAAQRVGLAIAPEPFAIQVALVGGDDHDRAHGRGVPHRLQHVGGSDDVRRVGADRVGVGLPHQRLRREMEDDLRLEVSRALQQRLGVADVSAAILDQLPEAERGKKARLRMRVERVAANFGTQGRQPKREPSALETRVAGHQDAAPAPPRDHQVFHGAFSDAHNSSR